MSLTNEQLKTLCESIVQVQEGLATLRGETLRMEQELADLKLMVDSMYAKYTEQKIVDDLKARLDNIIMNGTNK